MDNFKLIEDTIKIDEINKDGKVFERGKKSKILALCSLQDPSDKRSQQAKH